MTKEGNIFQNQNFKILWLGALICLIGDQLTLIALPWLVLKTTNSAIEVGTVLSIIGAPRAIFILIGGGLTDKFRPKDVLMHARAFSGCILLLLAFLVWGNMITMPMLYGLSFLLGLASAFTLPAGMSILPTILPMEQLKAGNGIMMTSMQLSAIVGPILAGSMIYGFSQEPDITATIPEFLGISIVFVVDAITFFVSVASLILIKVNTSKNSGTLEKNNTSILKDIKGGIDYLKQDRSLLVYILYVGMISFFVVGPSTVGIPVFVELKFAGGAWEYGFFLTIQGTGMMVGMVLATILPHLPPSRLGMSILYLDFLAGLGVLLFAFSTSVFSALSILFFIGIIGGFIQVVAFTWVQTRTKQEYLGRVMSYLMFAILGLTPISAALAGYLITKTSIITMYILVASSIMAIASLSLLSPSLRQMGTKEILTGFGGGIGEKL